METLSLSYPSVSEATGEEELSVTGYSQFTTHTAIAVPEAVTIIQQLGLPPEVTTHAINVFYRLENESAKQTHRIKSLRKKRKDRRVFICVLIAYNELDCPMDPVVVANITHLPHTEIEQAFNESEINITIDPVKLTKYYLRTINANLIESANSRGQANKTSVELQLNLDIVYQEIAKIVKICKQKASGREVIDNSPAKHISIGVICFYIFDIVQMNIPRLIIEKACNLSWACITKYHKQIALLYNT
jgi:hypothetical protein